MEGYCFQGWRGLRSVHTRKTCQVSRFPFGNNCPPELAISLPNIGKHRLDATPKRCTETGLDVLEENTSKTLVKTLRILGNDLTFKLSLKHQVTITTTLHFLLLGAKLVKKLDKKLKRLRLIPSVRPQNIWNYLLFEMWPFHSRHFESSSIENVDRRLAAFSVRHLHRIIHRAYSTWDICRIENQGKVPHLPYLPKRSSVAMRFVRSDRFFSI